jgi:hypothetical protein
MWIEGGCMFIGGGGNGFEGALGIFKGDGGEGKF